MASRRAVQSISSLLRQGITPEKIAMAIAVSAVLGVFPVLGTTTLLCIGASVAFGLNPTAMQLVGWVVYPLQLILIVPFMRVGVHLFGLRPVPPLSKLIGLMRADLPGTIGLFWPATLSAVGAWLAVAPLAAAGIYFTLLPPLRRMVRA